MLFNSYEFIFVFLPAVLAVFFLLGRFSAYRSALAWLVVASLFFYGWWNPAYLGLMLISIVFNFLLGAQITRHARTPQGKWLCTLGVVANLAALAYFKYMNFFVDNLNWIAGTHFDIDQIILPLAISFFTFQQISYLVDAYSEKVKETSFLNYCLFVTFFPQLIAGPIVHHGEMLPQFANRGVFRFNGNHVAIGGTIFLLGLFKKVVLADNVAVYATPVFSAARDGATLTFFEAWGGALAYTLQIYFDFSGYSDMAIGLARMFGIVLPLNFNSPYKSVNISDFWRRWHMTLSRFLRDYVYIPLGGNRQGPGRRYVNLMTVMLVGGLWHGAGWTFVIWGALHGIYLVINHGFMTVAERAGWAFRQTGWWRVFAQALTLLAVIIAWVFFRAESLDAALAMLHAMFGGNGVALPERYLAQLNQVSGLGDSLVALGVSFGKVPHFLNAQPVALMALLFLICWIMPNTQDMMRHWNPALDYRLVHPATAIERRLLWQPRASVAFILGCVAIYTFTSMTGVSEFLYFQF